MYKIHSTRRTVEVNTPRLTPPSTAGYGATGRATQQLGNEISKFAGVFDAFAEAEEKNRDAEWRSDYYQMQIETDKQLFDFGNKYQGDGKGYVDGSAQIYDQVGHQFQHKYANDPKLGPKSKVLVDRAKVYYQRKALTKGQQIQQNRSIIKATEISSSIREGMLTQENLKERGLGIVQEASDKFFKIVDGLPLPPQHKHVIKQNFIKEAAGSVERYTPTEILRKWKHEKEKELQAQKQEIDLTPDEIKRLEKETGLKRSKAGKVEDRGWPIEDNDPRLKKYQKLEGEILSSKVTTKISVNLPKNNVGKALHEASTKHNLDPGLVGQIAKIESNYNPNAKNPRSSARGLGQFINSTGRRYGLKNDGSDSVEAQATALAAHTRDNIAGFKAKVGRDPSPGEVYLAHFAGLGKAIALGNAPANARAVSVLGRKAAKANPGLIEGKTVAQVRAWADRKMGGKVAVSSFVQRKEQDLGAQIFSKINWKNVEKRHEAEQEQAFLQGVVSGEIKVSAHNSTFMKRYNKAHENILGPEVSLIDNENAKNYVLNIAKNKAPFSKQVFEKLTGHIESEVPEERAKGYALLDNIERDNRAQFNAGGKHANNLSKKLAVYRKLSSFYGNDGAVRRMALSEERFAKMSIDEMKAEKNKFLSKLTVEDIDREFSGIFTGVEVGFDERQKAAVGAEYKNLAAEAFKQTGDADAAKAIALHEIKKRFGTTQVTGESVVMKYPPEKFVHPDNIDLVRNKFKAVSETVVEVNREAFAARGYELTGRTSLYSDEITERSVEAYYNGKTKPESIIVLDGLGVQTDVPDSPKWRFKVEVKLDGETFFVPVDNYFEIDGIGQADHDRLVQTGLDNRAIGELEKEGGRGYSPNAPHNLLRYGAGWFMHDLLGLDYKHLKKPAELEDKREEIKMREALDSEGPK